MHNLGDSIGTLLSTAGHSSVGVNSVDRDSNSVTINCSDPALVEAAADWLLEFMEGDMERRETVDTNRFRFIIVGFV